VRKRDDNDGVQDAPIEAAAGYRSAASAIAAANLVGPGNSDVLKAANGVTAANIVGGANMHVEAANAIAAANLVGPGISDVLKAANFVGNGMAEQAANAIAAANIVGGANMYVEAASAIAAANLVGPGISDVLKAANGVTAANFAGNGMAEYLKAASAVTAANLACAGIVDYLTTVEVADRPIERTSPAVPADADSNAESSTRGVPDHGEPAADEPADAPDSSESPATVLDALIAIGMAGRDLTINTSTLAWLITIRQVQRTAGSAAARKVAVVTLATALTAVGVLWSAADGEAPGAAIFAGLSCLVAVLVAVLPHLGGE
jgi:hypothetical protein